MSKSYDVVGVGNALVDVQAHVEDTFLARHSLIKGAMKLVDPKEAGLLYRDMPPAKESSGGSAANTIAAMASLGSKVGFVGRVGADELGDVFAHDIRALGVNFPATLRDQELPTGRCLIMVTADGERTMNTSLGCNMHFSPADLDAALIASAKVVYLEGYLFDQPDAKAAYRQAGSIAKQAGCELALTLSDSFCVDRHCADFLKLIKEDVDILFANEHEITALFETSDWQQAADMISEHVKVAVLTRSSKGATIRAGAVSVDVPVEPVAKVMDLTGAGDAFAAGFLHGYCQNMSLAQAGRIGALAASEVISHFGARPEVKLSTFVAGKIAA